MNKGAVIYARYSSQGQNEQSIEGQIRIHTEYAESNGYSIVKIYTDKALENKRPPLRISKIDSRRRQRRVFDEETGNCICGVHVHQYSEEWSYDEAGHWHGCTKSGCTEKSDYAEHDFASGDCICGKHKPATKGLSYTLNADGQSYTCSGIGSVVESDILIASEYEGLPVTGIGASAFSGCTSLIKITIPKSIENIGQNAFLNCLALIIYCETEVQPSGWDKNWNVEECPVIWNCKNNLKDDYGDEYEQIDGIVYGFSSDRAFVAKQPTNLDGRISIPSAVTHSGVSYPVTNIRYSAFLNCSNIKELIVSDSVKTIGEGAFSGCSSLESLTVPFPGSIRYETWFPTENFKEYLFGYVFGENYYTGSYRAMQCYPEMVNSTKKIYYTDNYIPISLKNVTITGAACTYGSFSACKIENLVLGDSVFAYESAFYREFKVSNDNYYIESSIKSITACFYDLRHLPKSDLETLNIFFSEKRYQKSIQSSDKLNNSKKLNKLILPKELEEIGDSALSGCTSLTSIVYEGTMQDWDNVKKGTDWDLNRIYSLLYRWRNSEKFRLKLRRLRKTVNAF